MSHRMPAATMIDFATVNDRASATTKKLAKQQLLAEYFRALDDQDLPIAVRFCAGRAFAATDERVLGVSGAIISDVVLRITKMEPRAFYDLAVKHGEMGEALSTIWSSKQEWTLTLHDLSIAFEQIASTGNVSRKKELLHELFSRCATGREAAYLAKIIFSDLRTGVREGV